MENPVPTTTPDRDSLLLASLILMDVNQMVREIRMLVMVLLRYVAMGASIADNLVGMVIPGVPED
jgi:hypothetical protein